LLGSASVGIGTISPTAANQVVTSTGTGSNPIWSLGKPAGEIFMFGSTTCPTGSLAADGTSYLRSGDTTCSAGTGNCNNLYAAIGITYGHADSTHFNVPDLRGIFVRGAGTNGTLSNANSSAFSGTIGTYQNDKMQGHYHSNTFTTYDSGTFGVTVYPASAGGNANASSSNQVSIGSPTTDGTNGTPRTGAETNPANLGVQYCIAY
jgi:microcystin-dependent protein